MRDRRSRFLTSIRTLFIMSCVLAAATAEAQPRLTFDGDRLEVSGLTPGGAVAVHGVAIHSLHYLLEVLPISAVLPLGEGASSVVFAREGGIPADSVWAAVDLSTGQYTLDAPPRAPRRVGEAAFEGAVAGAREVRCVPRAFPLRQLNLLLVRPGEGAWRVYSRDGGPLDADGAIDGGQTLPLGAFQPLWGSAQPPAALAPGDLLIGVEGSERSIFALRVAGGKESR